MNVSTGKRWEPKISTIFQDKFKSKKKTYQFPLALSRAKSMPIITPRQGDRIMKISWNAYKLKKQQRVEKEVVEEQIKRKEEEEGRRRSRSQNRSDMVWLLVGYVSGSVGLLGYCLL